MSRPETYRFAAMGCEIVVGGASAGDVVAVGELFRERDRIFSRFVEGSELNRVNGCAGRPVRVSREFARMVELALAAAAESDGLVDPTLGAALAAAGYDVDFALLRDDGPGPTPGSVGCWRALRLTGRLLSTPAAVQLDLNGVVKGATVDDALALIGERAWISAGGDVAAGLAGLNVCLPDGGTVRLERGALATSGTDRRRWTRAGHVKHHLIDPRTGAPAASPWLHVTACAATCVGADVAAKIGFLRGESGPDALDARGIAARFVTAAGDIRANDTWRRSMEREREPVCT